MYFQLKEFIVVDTYKYLLNKEVYPRIILSRTDKYNNT